MSSTITDAAAADSDETFSESSRLLNPTETTDVCTASSQMPPAQTQVFDLSDSQRTDMQSQSGGQTLTEVETENPKVINTSESSLDDEVSMVEASTSTNQREDDAVVADTEVEVKAHATEDTVSTTSSSQGDMCRICHCVAEDTETLISPCDCCGSMKWVHQKCLQKWVKSRDAKKCELCGFSFNMTSRVKPFRKWSKLNMSSVERRRVLCSVTFHIVAITCVIWSLYVLIDRTTVEIKEKKLNWPFWTKLVVVAIGFTGGLVFMYVQCKTYVKLFRRWKQFNRVIYINDVDIRNCELDGNQENVVNGDKEHHQGSKEQVVIDIEANTTDNPA